MYLQKVFLKNFIRIRIRIRNRIQICTKMSRIRNTDN